MASGKKIVFVTGTRADFGKLKSLINILQRDEHYQVHLFVTGMHLDEKYGYTVHEIEKCGYQNIHTYPNHYGESGMDGVLAKTIEGFSRYTQALRPDLIVVHGDRAEALASAIVGAFNNILVAHIEGGELSGTIDELIRHAVSKLSHTHFVATQEAFARLTQMGERSESIYVIGSPDMDVLFSDQLPSWEEVASYYEIPFKLFGVSLYHPVTTEIDLVSQHAQQYVDALLLSKQNYVIIYPNNDPGSEAILSRMKSVQGNPRFRLFPSMRFEAFLTMLKHARFIVGNSSAGIREAPCYGVPTVNVGTRQRSRSYDEAIIHTDYDTPAILTGIRKALSKRVEKNNFFGDGNSDIKFKFILSGEQFWKTSKQKLFQDKFF